MYTLVTSLIGGLQMFDIPQLLVAKSGPDNATLTTSCFIYNQSFSGSYMYNRASAASMIMFVVIVILSVIMFRLLRDKDEEKLERQIRQQKRRYKEKQKAMQKEMKMAAKQAAQSTEELAEAIDPGKEDESC